MLELVEAEMIGRGFAKSARRRASAWRVSSCCFVSPASAWIAAMRSWASLTRRLAILARRADAVAMPKPGVASVVVGLPHRWTQHGVQLVFDGGDASGVGLPSS